MSGKLNAAAVALELLLIVAGSYSLWTGTLLPASYFLVIIVLGVLIAAQILRKSSVRLLVLQLALLLLFASNVYHLRTHFEILPFVDENWDYGVVRSFIQVGRIFVIPQPNVLTWYSGWPLLHSLVVSISEVSGIDPFYLFLGLPSVISLVSFLFVYLIVERFRSSLSLDPRLTPIALLLFVSSAETKFFPMQLVRQNLGIMILVMLLYTFYRFTTDRVNTCRLAALNVFLAMSLVATHHFTSFETALYFSLFTAVMVLAEYISRTRTGNKFRPRLASASATLGIALLMFAFLFSWWDSFGSVVWSTVSSSITHLWEVFLGVTQFAYAPPPAYYPESLTPTWAISLLVLRDLIVYVPVPLGLALLWSRKGKGKHEFFVIYSALVFGILFAIDNFAFRVEPLRVVELAWPFVALLSAVFYTHLVNYKKRFWASAFTASIVVALVFSSFIGLWGHSFAPIQLYDPSINPIEVGDRNVDFMRVNDFFSQRVPISNFQSIWTDDTSPLIRLLQPADYQKINYLDPQYTQRNPRSNELVCSFKDLNLYYYYSRQYSPVKSPEEAKTIRGELYEHLDNVTNRIYDDGKYRFWTGVFPPDK